MLKKLWKLLKKFAILIGIVSAIACCGLCGLTLSLLGVGPSGAEDEATAPLPPTAINSQASQQASPQVIIPRDYRLLYDKELAAMGFQSTGKKLKVAEAAKNAGVDLNDPALRAKFFNNGLDNVKTDVLAAQEVPGLTLPFTAWVSTGKPVGGNWLLGVSIPVQLDGGATGVFFCPLPQFNLKRATAQVQQDVLTLPARTTNGLRRLAKNNLRYGELTLDDGSPLFCVRVS